MSTAPLAARISPSTRPLAALLRRHPDWPLTAFLLPLPLWWVLGLGSLGYFLVAGIMFLQLLKRRRWSVVPGFGWWLVFLTLVVVSVSMLGLEVAGTQQSGASSRVVPTVFRLAEYGACTVFLLWAMTLTERELPTRRLGWLLGVGFLWTSLGGLLGSLAPRWELVSPVERIMPASLTGNNYVRALVHPAAAQVQSLFEGVDEVGRAAAPFAYTNTWGNAIGLLLPFAVVLALRKAMLSRWLWGAVIAVGLVTSYLSQNRGLWLSIILLAVYAWFRIAATGSVVTAVTGLAGALLIGSLLVASPLGEAIANRNTSAPSNDIRAFTVDRAVEIAMLSPVVGYGSTRSQLGSQQTIAVGKSPSCSKCGNMALGTNGQIWFSAVGQGLLGASLFTAFHVSVVWRHRHLNSALAIAASASVVASILFSFVYDRTVATGCLEFLAIAVLGRLGRQNPELMV